MFRFKKRTFLFLLTVVSCFFLTSCRYEEPPITHITNPDFFTTWVFSEENAVCNQGSAYIGNSQGQSIELKTLSNFTYEYTINGELVQSGSFIALSEKITFTPPIFSNSIDINSTYVLTGPNLVITTTELLNSGSAETCTVKRAYNRKR
ncbi:hypothetical protein [Roseivirga echinicomitans]|uniref:Lipocalin-like domain-containing protein n=1 Tax=Roseivirga echinicomitans TaxID=296218 RepID=A0A150X336_9BACT|nr:hypothetical protein [Roseivirga echinicomitans]KYG73124.1 hypothetical protein AWN68_10580 [Roseivirga echinicomitans]